MTDRKEEYPKSYISKQQKEILKNVCGKWTDNQEPTNSKTLSWDIAKIFNTEGSRIGKNDNKEEVLSDSHNASMSRSLKTLRERNLIENKDFASLFGEKFKGFIALSEEGKSWCELNVDGFKDKRERMRTERIKKEVKS